MMKKRFDDYTRIIELNKAIDTMYKKLCELELAGKKDSDEYNQYMDLIRFSAKKCEHYFLQYSLSDDYINDFVELLCDMSQIKQPDMFNYIDSKANNKIMRFIEHGYELSLLHHDSEAILDGKIVIEDVEYDYETGLQILKEEGYEEQLEEMQALKSLANQHDEYTDNLDDYYYAKIKLETHMFMIYLLDAINEEKNPEIKNRLIQEKYRIISQIRSLENSFLSGFNLTDDIDFTSDELNEVFKREGSLYTAFLKYQEDVVTHEQDNLMERNKKSYKSLDDKIQDILLSLKIKAHLSCISNPEVRETVIGNQQAAEDLAPSKIDKKVLKRSMKLNKKYVINDKHK